MNSQLERLRELKSSSENIRRALILKNRFPDEFVILWLLQCAEEAIEWRIENAREAVK